ncbi:DUF3634 family protein [Shewanella salipaludis]|uniref:DUF3634 family protein n=1 Tax=Shewanella salipaludis TaxID=2723052 RepID=A0A972FU42_9GAMM|nr:DUF3634 family protein [Shewanella salipaludis]NMH65697.1 DUF3634 family protein [Shewanella salipaludis]
MTPILIKIGFIALAVFLVYKLIFSSKQALTLFEMHFKKGRMTSHKGKIPEKFERDCRNIAKAEKLSCTIRAEKAGDVRLHVSANVSDNTTQMIRNLFPFEYYDKKSTDSSKLTG